MVAHKKFPALGRGLDALISTEEELHTSGSSSISEVPVFKIKANPNQPRREFSTEALQELAESIRQIGIIQPITLLTDSQGKKMGKTAGNAVWLDPNKTSPFDFYQYWRNVGDADVLKCIRMLTFLPLEQIDEMDHWEGEQLNKAKEILAYELTKMVHGEEEAEKAQATARGLFSGAADHENMPSTKLDAELVKDGGVGLLAAMVAAGLCGSNREARQLVQQGGVLVDGEKVTDPKAVLTVDALNKGVVIKKGKKVYHKVVL